MPPGSTCNPKSGAFQDKNLLRESPDKLLFTRGGVEDTRTEAKAKDTKKIQGLGQPFRGQTLSRPRTKDTSASVL